MKQDLTASYLFCFRSSHTSGFFLQAALCAKHDRAMASEEDYNPIGQSAKKQINILKQWLL